MLDYVDDFTVGILSSLAAAGLVYLLGCFLPRLAGTASLSNRLIPSLPRVNAEHPPGPLFPKPRATLLLLCLLYGFAMGWVNWSSRSGDDYPQMLQDEAEEILDNADYKAEEIIREAHNRASDLMRDAASERELLRITDYKAEEIIREAHNRASDLMRDAASEKELLRITEQAETAVRVVLLAEEEARRIMETAHHQARTIQTDARQRAQHLLHEADLWLSDPLPPTLGERLRDQVMRFIIWPLRGVALFALVNFILGAQTSTHISITSALAVLLFSLTLAVVDVIADISGLAFFVPMFIAAIVYAGMYEELSPGQLLLAAFSLLYQRFGIILGLVALQFVMMAALVGLGSSIGLVIVAIARAAGWDEIIQLGGWLITLMGMLSGILFSITIGQEIGHALAAVSFGSVLRGVSPPQNTPATPDLPPQ